MIVALCGQIEAGDKSGNARLARQISHQKQWKLLSVAVQPNGDYVYTVYDPGFGYKKITIKPDQQVVENWTL